MPEHIQTRQQSAKARKVSAEAIEQVFAYWKETVAPKSKAVLDDKRAIRIGWAIHDYGIESCKQAINGITNSEWHMGNNPQQKKYNGIDLIFRDADKIEGFIQRSEKRDAQQDFINSPRRKAGE